MTKAIVKFDNQENGKIDVYVRDEKEGYLQKADDNGAWVYWFDGPEGDTTVDYETSLEESKQELVNDYTLNDQL